MTELNVPAKPAASASSSAWIAYAEHLESLIITGAENVYAGWAPKHVAIMAAVVFVLGAILGHIV